MVDTRKKDRKRKRIVEGDSVKNLKKFVVQSKGKEKGKDVGNKSSKNKSNLVIHSDIKHSEMQLDSDFDVTVKNEAQVFIQKIIPTQRILKLRINSLIITAEEKDRLDLGDFYFFNGKDGDKKVDKKVKADNIGVDISVVKEAIDVRSKPLEKKVSELKKEVSELKKEFGKLRTDIKDEMQLLHVQLCRDLRPIIRDELRAIKDVGDKKLDSDSDDNSDNAGDDDEGDEGDEGGEGGDAADDAADEDVDVMVEEVHVDEDVDYGSKVNKKNDGDDALEEVEKKGGNEIELGHEFGDDVSIFVENNDVNVIEIANEVERAVMVEELDGKKIMMMKKMSRLTIIMTCRLLTY